MDAPLGPTSIHNALTPRLQESLGVPATADQHPPPLSRPRPAPHPGCPPCRSRSQRSPSLQVSEWSGGVPDREWPFLSAGLSRVTVLCVSCSFYRHQNPFGTWKKCGLVRTRTSLIHGHLLWRRMRGPVCLWWPLELFVAVLIQVLWQQT